MHLFLTTVLEHRSVIVSLRSNPQRYYKTLKSHEWIKTADVLVGCLLGERCNGQKHRLMTSSFSKPQRHQDSTHKREHDWLVRAPDMEE